MPTVPVIPDSAPFSVEQRAWLNGFIAGLLSRGEVNPMAAGAATAPTPALQPLTILFGSQTGTAESLARRAAKDAGKRGFAATTMDMGSYTLAQFAQEKNLLVITSTYGEGEPPDSARALHAALKANESTKFPGLNFSVCALGDTNYVQFCQCGKDFDAFLEKAGARRVSPRVDCDLEYEAKFGGWLGAALSSLASSAGAALAPSPVSPHEAPIENEPAYGRSHPFPAPALTVRCLSAPGSGKEVNHVEFSLEGSGLAYEAGDALGVVPQNCPELVNEVLSSIGCDGEEAVATPVGELPLRTALLQTFDLGRPSPDLLALLSAVPAGSAIENRRSQIETPLDVLDVLHALPAKPSPAEFVTRLKKLQPRLYSISSSPRAHPGQVHLTVGTVRYESGGRTRKGACSTFLAERALAAGSVGVFVHPNKAFKLPADGSLPVIMVGPGTGIAPFRAFMEERKATGATGRNWLFFGDQRESTDFLYRDELLAMKNDGLLTRLDLAWSRDQATKIYVQNRMLENSKEIFAWLEAGAYFYVCGDASRMARDVDAALQQIVSIAGGKTAEGAAAYLQAMRAAKRYARDVY